MREQGKSQGFSALDMNMWSDLNPFAALSNWLWAVDQPRMQALV